MIEKGDLKKLSLSCGRVLFCLGSEKDVKSGWIRNIGFALADKMMSDKNYKVIQDWVSFDSGSQCGNDKSMIGIVEDNKGRRTLLVKPFARDLMQRDSRGFDEKFKRLKLEHPKSYYAYNKGVVNPDFNKGDYISCGSSVSSLIKMGMINRSADKIIVSANSHPKALSFPLYAELVSEFTDNAMKDILMKNADEKFIRMDVIVPALYVDRKTGLPAELHVLGEPENTDESDIAIASQKFINEEYNKMQANLSFKDIFVSNECRIIHSAYNLQCFLSHLESIPASDSENIKASLLKMFEALDSSKIQDSNPDRASGMGECLLKAVYFISKRHPEWIDLMPERAMEIIKENNEFVMSVFKRGQVVTNSLYSIADPVTMIECHKNKQKNFIVAFFRPCYYDVVASTESMNAKTQDVLLACGVNIFDDENYKSQESLDEMKRKIKYAVKISDGVSILPNEFNIRDEFKCGNDAKIDLHSAMPDVRRSFVEILLVQEAIKQGKVFFGVCGGHQMIANLAGFDTRKLETPRVDFSFGESEIDSPTRGPSAVTSLHYHGIASTEKNKANLEKTNTMSAYNPSFKQGAMEDLRIKGNPDSLISTQYHLGFQFIADKRAKEMSLRLIDDKNVVDKDCELGKAILANCDRIVKKSLTLDQVNKSNESSKNSSINNNAVDKLSEAIDEISFKLSNIAQDLDYNFAAALNGLPDKQPDINGFTVDLGIANGHKDAYLASKAAKRPNTLDINSKNGKPSFSKRTNSSFSRY